MRECKGRILGMGVKKHLLVVHCELSNNVLHHRLTVKSSFMKVSIHSAACLLLNHLRWNRMPIFSNYPKAAFAKFLEVCLFCEDNDECSL